MFSFPCNLIGAKDIFMHICPYIQVPQISYSLQLVTKDEGEQSCNSIMSKWTRIRLRDVTFKLSQVRVKNGVKAGSKSAPTYSPLCLSLDFISIPNIELNKGKKSKGDHPVEKENAVVARNAKERVSVLSRLLVDFDLLDSRFPSLPTTQNGDN